MYMRNLERLLAYEREGGVVSLCAKLYSQSVVKSPLPKQSHFFYSCVCLSVCLEAEHSEVMNPARCHVKHISVLQMWFSLGWRPKRLAKPDCLPSHFFSQCLPTAILRGPPKNLSDGTTIMTANVELPADLHRQGLPAPRRHLCLFANFPSTLPLTSLTLVHKEFSTPDQMIV